MVVNYMRLLGMTPYTPRAPGDKGQIFFDPAAKVFGVVWRRRTRVRARGLASALHDSATLGSLQAREPGQKQRQRVNSEEHDSAQFQTKAAAYSGSASEMNLLPNIFYICPPHPTLASSSR